jgi:hypothetical protein
MGRFGTSDKQVVIIFGNQAFNCALDNAPFRGPSSRSQSNPSVPSVIKNWLLPEGGTGGAADIAVSVIRSAVK